MGNFPNAVQAVSTLTVEASGTASIAPAKSNSPFMNLSISIIPMTDPNSPYTVDVYHDGELVESHSFPSTSERSICHLSYPDFLFPANVGTNAIPKFFDPNRYNAPGFPISVRITNGNTEQRSFYIYCTYLEFDAPRFRKI